MTEGARCGSYLVVKNPAGTYDSAAIRQMAQYVLPRTKNYSNARLITDPFHDYVTPDPYYGVVRGGQQYFNVMQFDEEPGADKTIPDSLQWVAGGPDCFTKLEITNTGTNAIQITSIGATLISDAVRNTYTYNLLNICSVQTDQKCHVIGTGSGSPFCTYYAEITLAGGAAGTHVEAPLNGTASELSGVCALPLTIQPRDVATVFAKFSSPPWLYRTKLTFGVRSSAGASRLIFSSLQQNLAFIDNSTQFDCYGLNGSTFAREAPHKSSQIESDSHVCM
ncbi:MAG TPA: hypothetical protein VH349_13955 [Ktedonobacterales bacterium]